MQFPRIYTLDQITENYYTLVCTGAHINTVQGSIVRVDITKVIDVDTTNPKRPQAKTGRYSYCASTPNPNGWCMIRYDSPHSDAGKPGVPEHHKHHHRHDFRPGRAGVVILGRDDWPHVSEFLSEVYNKL